MPDITKSYSGVVQSTANQQICLGADTLFTLLEAAVCHMASERRPEARDLLIAAVREVYRVNQRAVDGHLHDLDLTHGTDYADWFHRRLTQLDEISKNVKSFSPGA